jgi:hypothetical protein
MLQIIEKNELAKRKRYRFSSNTIEKRNRKKKEKHMQKRRMAATIIKIDDLKEIISDGHVQNDVYTI